MITLFQALENGFCFRKKRKMVNYKFYIRKIPSNYIIREAVRFV